MGYTLASDLATHTELRQAVSIHFASNCYPPIPQTMLDTAIEAINACLDEAYDLHIDLPEGVTYRGNTTATALQIVDGQHLRAFVDALWNSDDE